MKAMPIIAMLFVLGCAPSTVGGLQKNPVGRFSFETSAKYEAVYRKATEYARRYETSFLGGAKMIVHSDLYIDIHQGRISIALHNIFGDRNVYLFALIRGETDRTKVDIYYGLSTWKRTAAAMKEAILSGG